MIRFLSLLSFALAPFVPAAEFTPRPWTEYQTIMWTSDSAYKKRDKIPLFFQRLKEMGITAGMVHGDGDLKPLMEHKVPYYVENMVNKGLCLKWSSKASDWDAVVNNWAKGGRPESAFVRDYCLDDPKWRAWGRSEVEHLVKRNSPHKPLLYDIRDELSTTMSANPFDYDFSPASLAAFREWLKTQYADLAALNAKWETKFGTWDEVMPFTTDQIKNRMSGGGALPRGNPDWQALKAAQFELEAALKDRTRWNFAPWCDFRTYMDIALARALDDFRQTAHKLDSTTPVGIEGTQMPHAFGGYDLWRLSQVLDWVEPYDVCNAREIFGSFMPGRPILATVGIEDAKAAQRRLWHLLLEGDKGCIIWWSEDCIDWAKDDYPLTPRAQAMAPVLKELTGSVARLVLRAKREMDPVYILYSQPSIQVAWLMESTVDGSSWHRRFSSYEATANRHAKVRDAWLKALQDRGYSPQFLSTEQLPAWKPERGAALILSQTLALSDAEVEAVKRAQASGVSVLANGAPGVFDEHGALRAAPPLPTPGAKMEQAVALNGGAVFTGRVEDYGKERQKEGTPAFGAWLAKAPLPAAAFKLDTAAQCRICRYSIRGGQLLAVERRDGGENAEKPVSVSLALPKKLQAYDLRTGEYLGEGTVNVKVDSLQPALVALVALKGTDVKALLE